MRGPIRIVSAAVMLAVSAAAVGDALTDGLAAYDVGDYEKSLELCLPLAEQGIATAQFCVGRLYANGFGVAMDDAKALDWYGRAAEQGHPEAQFNLGVMYANGWGVPMDDAGAAKWFRLAAEQGNDQAQMAYASALHSGRGVEKNLAEAYMWFAVAAELGNSAAISDRDDVGAELSETERAEADERAAVWLQRFHDGTLRADQSS